MRRTYKCSSVTLVVITESELIIGKRTFYAIYPRNRPPTY